MCVCMHGLMDVCMCVYIYIYIYIYIYMYMCVCERKLKAFIPGPKLRRSRFQRSPSEKKTPSITPCAALARLPWLGFKGLGV